MSVAPISTPETASISANDIIAYVMHTPYNTNAAILRDMLDAYGGQSNSESGAGEDNNGENLAYIVIRATEGNEYSWAVTPGGTDYVRLTQELSNNIKSIIDNNQAAVIIDDIDFAVYMLSTYTSDPNPDGGWTATDQLGSAALFLSYNVDETNLLRDSEGSL